MQFFTLKKKLILILVSLPLISILLCSVFLLNKVKKQAVDEFVSSTIRELQQVDKGFSFFMRGVEDTVNVLAINPVFQNAYGDLPNYTNTNEASIVLPKNLRGYALETFHTLKRRNEACPAFGEVFLGTEKGEYISSKLAKKSAGYDPRKRGWYKKAIGSKKVRTTSAYQNSSGSVVVSVVSPVFSGTHQPIGVTGLDVTLDEMTGLIENTKMGETGYIILVQDDGVILANPKMKETNFKKISEVGIPAFDLLGKMGEGNAKVDIKGEEYLAVVHLSPTLGYRFIGLITKAEVMQESRALIKIVLILSFVLIVIFVILAIYLANNIVRPITRAVTFADIISQGDLTEPLGINQKDEIGVLARSLNSMSDNLRKIFADIAKSSHSLSAAATELESISGKMADEAEQTSEKSNSVASSADKMSENMNSVASAAEQASGNLQTIVSASEELSATIDEVASSMGKGSEITSEAVNKADNISKKMGLLGQAASQINQVTETIADISDQTNLLALNATIEAARAGEAGKGFAVVANEIKELAKQTADATGEISDKIGNAQTLTQESVEAIEEIVNIINKINEIVSSTAAAIEEQSATTQEISNNVAQAAQGVENINENVNQASLVSNEVSSDVHEVSALADDMSAINANVNNSAAELSKLSEGLNAIVAQFKLG